MVNLNPPTPPKMEIIDGIKVRPEDVERVKEQNERRLGIGGVQDPTPVGVTPPGTDNRRKTQRELYDGEPFDPAAQVLVREDVPDAAPDDKPKRAGRKSAEAKPAE